MAASCAFCRRPHISENAVTSCRGDPADPKSWGRGTLALCALGNVKRTTQQSRMMARKLLALHLDRTTEQHRIDKIVEALSSHLYYHGHPINRKEAKEDLELHVVNPESAIEETTWKLYEGYESTLRLSEPFLAFQEFLAPNPDLSTIGDVKVVKPETAVLGYIESAKVTHRFMLECELAGSRGPDMVVRTQMLTVRQGWETEPEVKEK